MTDVRERITVTGIVQGVGFRPHVFRLAVSLGLTGYVLNTSRGVVIEVEGDYVGRFLQALLDDHPPLAVIETVKTESLPPAGYRNFEIKFSESIEGAFSLISPDIAVCPDCLRDILNPADRRYLYPFTNCTNCGPRYSIIEGVPYDRNKTTMRDFSICPDCFSEYEDPSDRRFHAQPVACPNCGPRLVYQEPGVRGQGADKDGEGPDSVDVVMVSGDKAMVAAIESLKAGKVVAIKGIGGFQLACDAYNHDAVGRLRANKRHSRKPFALMARDMDVIRKHCNVSHEEELLLTSPAAPVVILRSRPGLDGLSPDVAPGNRYIGFMLPYTPLHYLLFNHPDISGAPDALVMTSGNITSEPIVIDNDEALVKLSGLAERFLYHDRGIYMRVDDSVARVVSGIPRLVRRARGYTPLPLELDRELPEILACGPELKNTLCITKDRYAIVSQHIGDMVNYETLGFYEETLGHIKKTFNADPKIVAHDMHPDYMGTNFAVDYRYDGGGQPRRIAVQHHHAHIAACMTENGVRGRVIGVAFDGTGYGLDGNIWGGEFLDAGLVGFGRYAHLNYIPLPGGDAAVHEPWRIGLSLLAGTFGPDWRSVFHEIKKGFGRESEVELVWTMLERGFNSPLSSGMGRLFDGISSLTGLMDAITYEGEAAIALEMVARRVDGSYPYNLKGASPTIIDTTGLVEAVVSDIKKGVSVSEISGRFHNTVRNMTIEICLRMRDETGIRTVALSGGVFQNALLFGLVETALSENRFRVVSHSKLPPNDGCISFGQAAVAAAVIGL